MKIPQNVIDHCNSHPLCKGCPLGTCSATLVEVTDPRWQVWMNGRIAAIREIKS